MRNKDLVSFSDFLYSFNPDRNAEQQRILWKIPDISQKSENGGTCSITTLCAVTVAVESAFCLSDESLLLLVSYI